MPLNQKIDPQHTALIVIDIQNDFCHPSGVLGTLGRDMSAVDPIIDKLEQCIDLAQRHQVFTAYTQQIYDPQHLNDLQKEQYELDGKLVTCDVATTGYHLYRLQPSQS